VRVDHLVGVYHRPERSFTITVVACTWLAREPAASDEAQEAGWFDVGRPLPEPMKRVVRERIDDAIAGVVGAIRVQPD
jgi:hypothetical protein